MTNDRRSTQACSDPVEAAARALEAEAEGYEEQYGTGLSEGARTGAVLRYAASIVRSSAT